jgi:site-specific DNA recombinase
VHLGYVKTKSASISTEFSSRPQHAGTQGLKGAQDKIRSALSDLHFDSADPSNYIVTANVLLSFAQFEREVTGERIRDKSAASKRKGMWMGGRVPAGYDAKERKLIVNAEEADFVRRVFRLYLELGCVSRLKVLLDREAIKSKERTSPAGNQSGGTSYSRGALYRVLQNRIYVGEIQHRGKIYPGEHTGIIPRELWEQVQAQLRSDNQGRRNGLKANCSSLLVCLLQDAEGNRFRPSFTVKNGKRYRYYFCSAKVDAQGAESKPVRVPAHDVEQQVSPRLQAFLQSPKEARRPSGQNSADHCSSLEAI